MTQKVSKAILNVSRIDTAIKKARYLLSAQRKAESLRTLDGQKWTLFVRSLSTPLILVMMNLRSVLS